MSLAHPGDETSPNGWTTTSVLAGTSGVTSRRGTADRVACCVLRVRQPAGEAQVYNLFSSSIALSAARCLLTYVLIPIVGGLVGALPSVAPTIGLPLGALALVFDVRAVRRFFQANHRWRWAAAALYLAIMAMVCGLMAIDISHLA